MNKDNIVKTSEEFEKGMQDLRELEKSDPEAAKIVAKAALIRSGVLNEDVTPKESIITESHNIGFYEDNVSYETIVHTMRKCMNELRNLGDGDSEKTRELIGKSLIDSGFVDKFGHLIVREKRAPHVEAFFRRVEEETNAKNQRVRKK